MKKISSLIAILLLCTISLFAQAPEKFTYQAVVRNASNNLVANAQVGVRVSILQGSASGSAVYVEVHSATSNANGLVTVNIGDGTVQQGIFANIDWANGPFFLKTETDPNGGTNYNVTSTQQLLSVPYALYAATSGNGEGPQGPVGPQGPQGDTGATGPQGPAGQDGVSPTVTTTTTPTGTFVVITDASGSHQFFVSNGSDGAPGAQGPQGIQGATGPQGPTGPAGANGTNGTNGADGRGILNIIGPVSNGLIDTYTITYTDGTTSTFTVTNGAAGAQGPQGPIGPAGAQGPQGEQGLQGATGPQGPAGADGTNGTNGADGRGILNIIGPVSNGLIDSYTITYTDGTTSTFTVTNGAAGAQGPQGPIGPAGAQGPQGEQGLQGATGPQGPAGADGTNGTNGADGRGIANIAGPMTTGLTDTYTINYTDGTTSTFTVTNGAAGAQGPQGPIGPAGAQGPQGEQGLQGATGPQGPVGPAGANGTNGISPTVTAAAAGSNIIITVTDGTGTHTYTIPTSSGEITQQPSDWNATTGVTQILNKPNLATVATTGNYNDLNNKPTLFSGNYNDLTNKPALFSGNYNDLTNKPIIPTVPTDISAFNNDAGYLTSYTEQQVLSLSNDTIFLTGGSFVKLPEGFSGSWNDLTDKPANITVPDSVSAFVNDAGYITQTQLNTLLSGFNSLIDSLSNEIYTLRMMMDTTLYTVTAVANNDSMGSVFGGGSFRWGAIDTLIAVPDSGYRVKYWVSNLGDTLTNNTIVITVKQNVVWTACFDLQELPQWENYNSDVWHDMYTTISSLKTNAILNTSRGEYQHVWDQYDASQYTDAIMSSNIDYYFPMLLARNKDANIEIKIPQGMNFDLYEYDSMSGNWVIHNSLFAPNENNTYRYTQSETVKAIYGIKLINQ